MSFATITSPKKPLSDLRNFFRNTITPTDRQTISQFLLDTESELEGCEVEINRLQVEIHLLEIKKRNLKSTMERSRSLLSPIHRLPPEVLTKVFSFACEVNDLSPLSPPPTIRIATVCGRWRDTMLGTPSLWSSLHVSFGSWMKKLDVLIRLTILYMGRSKNTPLSLEISFPDEHYDPDPSEVIDILSRDCGRWHFLSLSIPETFTRPELLFPNLQKKALPLLKRLHLTCRLITGRRSALANISRQLLSSCPSLQDVLFDGIVNQVSKFGLPLSQVTRAVLNRAYTPAAMKLLGKLPHVQELVLSFIVKQKGAEVQHILSSSIRTLTLSTNSQDDLDDLFRHLTIPSLESLTLSSYPKWRQDLAQKWPDWQESAAVDFLTRSGCSITSLCLDFLPITDIQAVSLLKLIPTLSSLRIEELELPQSHPNRVVTSAFLRHFVVDQECYRIGRPGTTFIPLLADITLKVKAQDFPEEEFFTAVASRWVPDATRAREIGIECLRSVDVTMSSNGKGLVSVLESLKCFRYAGLRLNVNCCSAME